MNANIRWKNASIHEQNLEELYIDKEALQKVIEILKEISPLVSMKSCLRLKEKFAKVAKGEEIIIQGGYCSEPLEEKGPYDITRGSNILERQALVNALKEMSDIITSNTNIPTTPVGRLAGQFAKPRSNSTEKRWGKELTSYRGELVNKLEFNEEARAANPKRMLDAIKVISDFVKDLRNPYISHEALHLIYEAALTRQCPKTGKWHASSAHMLWLGDRTRQPDGAHVEFLSGVENPIGIKCGSTMTPEDLKKLLTKLNPNNEEGKITLISRMGADKVEEHLLPLIKAVKEGGHNAVWLCDPMHGNTYTTNEGVKTRSVKAIKQEIRETFEVHKKAETILGGVHLEMTGLNVTECVGGKYNPVSEDSLSENYTTLCDPRLNKQQSLEIAEYLSDLINQHRPKKQPASALVAVG